jgi:hypothetical protein
MSLSCMPRTIVQNSNAEVTKYFIDPNVLFASNSLASSTWLYGNRPSAIHDTSSLFSPTRLTPVWFKTKRANCNLSLGLPLIFLISQDAGKLLSAKTDFKRDVSAICQNIARFAADKNLNMIGEASIFQEDESEPKLFLNYGIANRPYGEILVLWDQVCKKLAETIPVNILEKIAVTFDQL